MPNAILAPEALLFLEKEVDKYPLMKAFLKDRNINSGKLLSPQGIATVTSEMAHVDFVTEALSFLDAMSLYDAVYGVPNQTYNCTAACLADELVRNRTIVNPNLCLNADATKDHDIDKPTSANELLQNNPTLRAVLVFSVLMNVFCK